MIEKKYEKRDGTEGVEYKLEKGDVVAFKKKLTFEGNFGDNHLMITTDDKTIRLTGGQAKFFDKFEVAEGTEVLAEEYTNTFGTFIGLKYKNQSDVRKKGEGNSSPSLSMPEIKPGNSSPLPTLSEAPKFEMTNDEETILNQLIGNSEFEVWKKYAKESAHNLKEAMGGLAKKIGMEFVSSTQRSEEIYKLYITKV